LQTEELLSAKLGASVLATELRSCEARRTEWRKRWRKLQPDLRRMRHALAGTKSASAGPAPALPWTRLMEFLDWNQEFVDSMGAALADLAKAADQDQRSLGAMVDNLLDDMTKVVMQPFATLLDVFPRFVRELSRQQGKSVELVIRGDDIEIDRRILEEMKDPLIHLVRNCLDHGVETPRTREHSGKRAQATVTIDISAQDGSNIELLLSDDGAGIDASLVKVSAVKLGLVSADDAPALSDREALLYIFQSGVSTSPIITDISGRGLGLAIVKEKVEKLGGALFVETQSGKGTAFRIILPLTLARFRGVLVRVDEYSFVLPTHNVERVARVDKKLIKTVEGRETIVLDGRAIALSRLGEVLELPRRTDASDEPDFQPAVVLSSGNQRIAFVVEEIVSEQEVLVKTLGRQLAHVRNIAGATIVGAGKVVPILNVAELMQSAVRASAAGRRATPAATAAVGTRRKSVLVAEDSITSRILMKNILEAAGYRVETAVDGIDAITKLRGGEFDLVVSDVEMPRMDGFGFTAKVRADKKFAELPVVLVTALESREDRERGIDVGANAYMVKSSFDQSNLLEIIRRLV
jgi:two-component system chemotaxis sensor kinase CheA